MKTRPVTITDIAKVLNLAPSTVSRALHNSPSIGVKTKRAVVGLAKKLDYQPNLLAISLLTKKTKTIGLIVPEITSYFFATAINGIQDVLGPQGYRLLISQSNESFEEEKKILEALSHVRVDGILISPSITTSDYGHLERLKSAGMPLVIFDRDCQGFEGDKVLVDDYDGAFQAVEYLIKTGCKRIAHIVGPTGLSISKSRLNGYLDALKQNNIPINPDLIVTSKGFTSECGEEVVIKLLDLEVPPDAIFVINDQVAIGAMLVIRNKGFVIPDDISVIGFDDEPYCAYFNPSLSSVWQPIYGMGMLSAKILLNHCEEKPNLNLNRREIFKPELMLRDSTKKIG